MASSVLTPFSINKPVFCLKVINRSATAVLSTIIESLQLVEESTTLNSKRLPVKVIGVVLLQSVLSRMIFGIFQIYSIVSIYSWSDKYNKTSIF